MLFLRDYSFVAASYTANIIHISVLRVYMPAALNLVLCTQLLIRTTKLPQASSVLVFFVPARAWRAPSFFSQSRPCSLPLLYYPLSTYPTNQSNTNNKPFIICQCLQTNDPRRQETTAHTGARVRSAKHPCFIFPTQQSFCA